MSRVLSCSGQPFPELVEKKNTAVDVRSRTRTRACATRIYVQRNCSHSCAVDVQRGLRHRPDRRPPFFSATPACQTLNTLRKRESVCVCVRERDRERESRSTCVTPGERLRQSLRKQTKNEVARRGLDGKKIPKKVTSMSTPCKRNS